MRSKLGYLSLLIIDEISMVGANPLYTIHRRLSEIMTSDEPFGGISVIAVGDLSQLPPVAQKQSFESISEPFAALYGSIWQKHFQLIEHSERNRIRTSNHTDDDVQLIKSREIQNTSTIYPTTALHIFAFNKDVDSHNKEMIQKLKEPVIIITAIDSKTDEQTGKKPFHLMRKEAWWHVTETTVSSWSKVMMTTNADTSDGLVKIRSKLRTLVPDGKSTPIAVHKVTVKLRKVSSKRTQFPLTLAWAVTILRIDPSKRLRIVAIYIPPNTKNESYFKNLENLLCAIPSDSVPTILCEDFNANIASTDLKTSTLKGQTAYYGFLQYIQQPTHRKGASLEHVYVNRNFDNSEITLVTPVHFF
ncbi:unnamed protein product [Mytilus edulis]|uniref:ATP-dependent DNA helicase n=1 Tax=Mytilus edulis TaxID=6550 RepID=A0A8S3QU81_MYTED|nr:unnamed protein product [Mytilus edulis]